MKSLRAIIIWSLLGLVCLACSPRSNWSIDENLLASMGTKHRLGHEQAIADLTSRIQSDSTQLDAWLAMADHEILLFIFGYTSRESTIPIARQCLEQAQLLDPTNTDTYRLSGMLNFLDWDWEAARIDFRAAIDTDSANLSARHWYSLWLVTMGRIEEGLIQHDTIAGMDMNEDYLVGRGSMYYFDRDNEKLRDLMLRTIAKDPSSPWPYDWLGMAYVETQDYANSIDTYLKAFELADGLVEVGAGLGHALGLAGEYELAKKMADYYALRARTDYLPQMQRAFIHISIEEHDEAMRLLEEAYAQKSWFLIFMGVEPWLDPLRKDPRFQVLRDKMNYPGN